MIQLRIFDDYLVRQIFPHVKARAIVWKYICTTRDMLFSEDIHNMSIEYYDTLLRHRILPNLYDDLRVGNICLANDVNEKYCSVRRWMSELNAPAKNPDEELDFQACRVDYQPMQNTECMQEQEYSRHFRSWVEKIFGLNMQYHIRKAQPRYDAFREMFLREFRTENDRRKVTPHRLRCVLKKYNHSKLNEVATAIMKDVCGATPPVFSEAEIEHIKTAFLLFVTIYDYLCISNAFIKSLRKHYPFLIYKIIDMKYRSNPHKRQILHFIPLQKQQTLIKNDQVWFEIIEEARARGISEIASGSEEPIQVRFYFVNLLEATSVV